MDDRLMDLFTLPEYELLGNYQPELHVVGLAGPDLVAAFEHLNELGARWTYGDFHLTAEDRTVTVQERPDVAQLVVDELATACIAADGITVDGVELPTLSMFLHPTEIHFFWEAGPPWTERSAEAFVALLGHILEEAPSALLRPDPLLVDEARRDFAEALAERLGRAERIELTRRR